MSPAGTQRLDAPIHRMGEPGTLPADDFPHRDKMKPEQLAAVAWAGIEFDKNGRPFRLQTSGQDGGVKFTESIHLDWQEIWRIENEFKSRAKDPIEQMPRPGGALADDQDAGEHVSVLESCKKYFAGINEIIIEIQRLELDRDHARRAFYDACAEARLNGKSEPKTNGATAIEAELERKIGIAESLRTKHATVCQREQELRLPLFRKQWSDATITVDRAKSRIGQLEKQIQTARQELEQAIPRVKPFARGEKSLTLAAGRKIHALVLRIRDDDKSEPWYPGIGEIISDPLNALDKLKLTQLRDQWIRGISPSASDIKEDSSLPERIFPRMAVLYFEAVSGKILKIDIASCARGSELNAKRISAGSTLRGTGLKESIVQTLQNLEPEISFSETKEYASGLTDWPHIPTPIERGRL